MPTTDHTHTPATLVPALDRHPQPRDPGSPARQAEHAPGHRQGAPAAEPPRLHRHVVTRGCTPRRHAPPRPDGGCAPPTSVTDTRTARPGTSRGGPLPCPAPAHRACAVTAPSSTRASLARPGGLRRRVPAQRRTLDVAVVERHRPGCPAGARCAPRRGDRARQDRPPPLPRSARGARRAPGPGDPCPGARSAGALRPCLCRGPTTSDGRPSFRPPAPPRARRCGSWPPPRRRRRPAAPPPPPARCGSRC